eukprot:gene702-12007_t
MVIPASNLVGDVWRNKTIGIFQNIPAKPGERQMRSYKYGYNDEAKYKSYAHMKIKIDSDSGTCSCKNRLRNCRNRQWESVKVVSEGKVVAT